MGSSGCWLKVFTVVVWTVYLAGSLAILCPDSYSRFGAGFLLRTLMRRSSGFSKNSLCDLLALLAVLFTVLANPK